MRKKSIRKYETTQQPGKEITQLEVEDKATSTDTKAELGNNAVLYAEQQDGENDAGGTVGGYLFDDFAGPTSRPVPPKAKRVKTRSEGEIDLDLDVLEKTVKDLGKSVESLFGF